MHKNDLFDWIVEQKIEPKKITNQFLIDLLQISILSGNVHSFIYCIDKGVDLSNNTQKIVEFLKISSGLGFVLLTELIFSLFVDDYSFYDLSESSIIFGNIAIFKLFCELKNFPLDFDTLLRISFEKKYSDISYFILDKYYQPKSFNIVNVISFSICETTSDTFNLIEQKFKFEELMKNNLINIQDLMSFLNVACFNRKYEISCKLIDFILKHFALVDFTGPFLEACVSGSEEMYQPFIDLKVFINYEEIMKFHKQIFTGNWKIAIKLLDQVDSDLKESFSTYFFLEAYEQNNKEAFQILLPQNLYYSEALYFAVFFNDIESVNKVLEHNSKPSIVNKNYINGTVLNYAVSMNYLDIVKRLLSVPGIDVNLCSIQDDPPLIVAIKSLNIEATDLLLDFYGDTIQSQLNQICFALSELEDSYALINPLVMKRMKINYLFCYKDCSKSIQVYQYVNMIFCMQQLKEIPLVLLRNY
ncbi:hypothetical protein M9Y10_003176 [Tritrichomonas musculus]|uniref:DUF3447 domain-containing protein n=1 Tax=Tritrichomonas musculus TaxID=1915356 RepID=A0ABR2JNT4_9EUKA